MTKYVSLETARLMKEAGWNSPTEFSYLHRIAGWARGCQTVGCAVYHTPYILADDFVIARTDEADNFRSVQAPAPDTTELLEALPNPRNITVANLTLYRCDDNTWEAYFSDWGEGDHAVLNNKVAKGMNAVECLADLWLSLRKQKLV